jgi:hypothetical protein
MECLYELQAAQNYKKNLSCLMPFQKKISMLNLLPQKPQIGLRKFHV